MLFRCINIQNARTHGEVACTAGHPRHAGMISQAMGHSPTPLPWYRVVRSYRTLAYGVGSECYLKQKALLEQEEVQVLNGKVIPVETGDDQDLDVLLGGHRTIRCEKSFVFRRFPDLISRPLDLA